MKPKQVANKILTSITRTYNIPSNESIQFSITECTRGSKKKEYYYEGLRKRLDKPVIVRMGKKDIYYNYTKYT